MRCGKYSKTYIGLADGEFGLGSLLAARRSKELHDAVAAKPWITFCEPRACDTLCRSEVDRQRQAG